MQKSDLDQFELFLKGSIVGLLIGDALGYPYEGIPDIQDYEINMVPGSHGESVGSWSFPGSFALATMASLNECEQIVQDDLIEKFNDVYIAGYLSPDNECKDIGPITGESIKNFTNGIPPDICGATEQSNDNDCLLRILPVGLYFAIDPIETIVDQAHKVCIITHADVYSQVCCAAFCLIVRNILLQKAEKIFDTLDDYYHSKQMAEHSDALKELKEMRSKQISNSRSINDTFWSAWSTYASSEQNFEKSLIQAIYIGGDTNGRAALVGALSGLANGLDSIPPQWLRKLNLTSESIEVIQTFVNSIIKKVFQPA